MGLSAIATAHVGAGRGVAPIPPLIDWSGTVPNATVEYDADDLAIGAWTTWTDRNLAAVQTKAGANVVDAGINGRHRIGLTGSGKQMDGAAGSTAQAIGGLSSDWLIVVVADVSTIAIASNTGDWADSGLVSDSSFRMGLSLRRRLTGPDVYSASCWFYDGVFTPGSVGDFGATLTGPRVYHIRKNGTSIYSGAGGVWGSAATKSSAITGPINVFQIGGGPNHTNQPTGYIYKVCCKSNGLLDTPTTDAISGLVAEYS